MRSVLQGLFLPIILEHLKFVMRFNVVQCVGSSSSNMDELIMPQDALKMPLGFTTCRGLVEPERQIYVIFKNNLAVFCCLFVCF